MQNVDLQRLIQIIVEEVTAAAAAPSPARCQCHSVLYECCPDRIRGVLEAGATRLGLHASGGAAGTVAGMIDHTLLKPDATRKDVEALCREAAEYKLRQRLREPDVGGDVRAAAQGHAGRRLLGGRVSARARRRRIPSTTRRGARSSTARARSTWSSTSAR